MKKVLKSDLKYLIASHYWEFIDPNHKPINDMLSGRGETVIEIDSVCIRLVNRNKLFSFESPYVKDAIMNEFAKNIEAITFGNLKVIRIRDNEVFIANAYDVID